MPLGPFPEILNEGIFVSMQLFILSYQEWNSVSFLTYSFVSESPNCSQWPCTWIFMSFEDCEWCEGSSPDLYPHECPCSILCPLAQNRMAVTACITPFSRLYLQHFLCDLKYLAVSSFFSYTLVLVYSQKGGASVTGHTHKEGHLNHLKF